MIQSFISKSRLPGLQPDGRAISSPLNAQFSTGPQNTSVVKFNALRHGLSAKRAILIDESEEEYEEFSDAITKDLNPQGIIQEQLTGEIISGFWRLRRAKKAESAIFFSITDINEILEKKIDYCQVFNSSAMEKLGSYETRISNKLHRDIAFLKVLQGQSSKEG